MRRQLTFQNRYTVTIEFIVLKHLIKNLSKIFLIFYSKYLTNVQIYDNISVSYGERRKEKYESPLCRGQKPRQRGVSCLFE